MLMGIQCFDSVHAEPNQIYVKCILMHCGYFSIISQKRTNIRFSIHRSTGLQSMILHVKII